MSSTQDSAGKDRTLQNCGREAFVVLSISLNRENGYLLELVPKSLLRKRTRKERWEEHDEYYGNDEAYSPFMIRGGIAPICIPLSSVEFGELNPHVGMEVRLRVTPIGV